MQYSMITGNWDTCLPEALRLRPVLQKVTRGWRDGAVLESLLWDLVLVKDSA